MYHSNMPKLWNQTVETHRDAVRASVLDAAACLVAAHGVTGVTMSAIAQAAGIGRATLYKYFPDVESIVLAWHERQVDAHLTRLIQIRDQTAGIRQQTEAVLRAYAFLSNGGHGDADAARLHQGGHAVRAQRNLHGFLAGLLKEGADAEVFRTDVAAEELASFCLHALEAAAGLNEHDAVLRLVKVTLDALQPALPPAAEG